MKIKKFILLSTIFILFITATCVIIYAKNNYPKFMGESKDQYWKAELTRSDKTSIGPNYYLELYWKGNKNIEKEIKIKTLKLKIDGKVYEENENYDLAEYATDKSENAPDHITTFDFIPEEKIKGHKLEIEIEWKNQDSEKSSNIKIKEKNIVNLN
ncbi:DUF4944 domain-containing protein [Bacillus altitudinis]|uniref:DUF4944 domain-containing protein n=1 Tax=Bacillus altitudinis TaxID=293387 RepID=UPI002281766D|nr:DUF4944 domain-containing protein [Bacillus altitudinis]MCY7671974.1 YdhH/YoaO family protein [Bacillus altitudinis]